MANRTVKDATSVKGTNPQYLIEKIIRSRIYDSRFWKEECFALTAELLVDKSMALKFIGGVYGGNVKPSPFICLTLKMLQIQPDKDIVIEFIQNEDYKYVRALGAFYMRLTGSSPDIYKFLEPLYNDYRKLRILNRAGQFELTYMDEFIDKLLTEERVCDVQLARIQKRSVLEENGLLEPRISILENDPEEFESSDDAVNVSADIGKEREPPEEHRDKQYKEVSRHKRRRRSSDSSGDRKERSSPRSGKHRYHHTGRQPRDERRKAIESSDDDESEHKRGRHHKAKKTHL